MAGADAEDGDVLEMGQERPSRRWAVGRRSRLALAVAGACALLAVAGTLAALRLDSHGPADPALARLVAEVTTVPLSKPAGTSYSVSASSGNSSSASIALLLGGAPSAVSGPPLTAGGKPEVLYVATEFCPYCVAENWALIVALSRFGTFSGLRTSRSPYFDDIPPVDGWTFYGSTYQSRYLAFVPVETYSNVLKSAHADPASAKSYRALQHLTTAQQAAVSRYDQGRETPFFDFAGQATLTGSAVEPVVLADVPWSKIAADLRRPATPVGGAILAAAATLTSELCQLTGDRPAAACPKWVRLGVVQAVRLRPAHGRVSGQPKVTKA